VGARRGKTKSLVTHRLRMKGLDELAKVKLKIWEKHRKLGGWAEKEKGKEVLCL